MIFKSCLLITFLCALISCGKKENSAKPEILPPQPYEGDLETFLSKQQIVCKNGSCPNYIAKVIVQSQGKFKYCTGTLVDPRIILTSASCLAPELRYEDVDCEKQVFILFAKGQKVERAICRRVKYVSQIEGEQPMVWREDVAYLELSKPLYFRTPVHIDRDGVNDKENLEMVGLEHLDPYLSEVKRQDCEAVHGTYVHPLSSSSQSPNIHMTACHFKNGMSGAPLIDEDHHIKAIVSAGLDDKQRSSIEATKLPNRPMKQMLHATNFYCAPGIYDFDRNLARECTKPMSMGVVDSLRGELADPANLFKENVREIQKEISISENKYIKMRVELVPAADKFNVKLNPECFKNVSDWISPIANKKEFYFSFNILKKSLKKYIDEFGRLKGETIQREKENHYFEFSPKQLRTQGNSVLKYWESEEPMDLLPNVTACPSLL